MPQATTMQTNQTAIQGTEIGRAVKFTKEISDTHCYVKETNNWHIYDGATWHPADKKHVQQRALDFIRSEGAKIASIDDDETREERRLDFKRYANKAAVMNLTELASIQLHRDVTDFDKDKMALSTPNGWLDLRTGRLNGSDASKLFSMSTNSSYVGAVDAPIWRKTIADVFHGKPELAEYFQKAIGYSLIGGNPQQQLFICHGAGANGKSLLLETIRKVLGSYAQSLPITTLMRGKLNAGAATPELARLRGVRFALASETEKGQTWSANRIKTLTGGDTITARGLYQDIIEFESDATIWVACNHKPEVDSSDAAMWRRMCLIPFSRVFTSDEQDPDLSDKLTAEYPGILHWMLQGLAMYREQAHLCPPQAVANATDAYRNEMDSVKRFIEMQAELNPTHRVAVSDLKAAYQFWCKDEGLKPLAASHFNNALEAAGCTQSKSGSTRMWKGISLRDENEMLLQRFGM